MAKRFKNENIREPISGFKDVVGREARLKSFISSKISELFQRWGYDQIVFPLVERASSFSEEVVGGSPWPEWDKRSVFYLHVQDYFESYKELPAQVPALLIPEGTISVSRWLAKILVTNEDDKKLFPVKVFYITPCFRNELLSKVSSTKGREFNQVGVEILGTTNLLADIEILFLIYQGFRNINIPKKAITIRVGSSEIFNLLCAESKVDELTRIDFKNSLDTIAEARAGKNPERLNPEIKKIMKKVDSMNLNESLLNKWNLVCNTYVKQINKEMRNILGYSKQIDEINRLASVFQLSGISCFIDPSVVRSHEYYTGIVYEVDLKIGDRIFVEVAGGGRYNKLIGKFLAGKEYQIPAVGFAYGLERLVEFYKLVEKSKNKIGSTSCWTNESSVDIVMYSAPNTTTEVRKLFAKAEESRGKNKRVSIYVGDGNKVDALRYAKKVGAKFSVR